MLWFLETVSRLFSREICFCLSTYRVYLFFFFSKGVYALELIFHFYYVKILLGNYSALAFALKDRMLRPLSTVSNEVYWRSHTVNTNLAHSHLTEFLWKVKSYHWKGFKHKKNENNAFVYDKIKKYKWKRRLNWQKHGKTKVMTLYREK